MIHYSVYFSLRDPSEESASMAIIREFLGELLNRGAISGFRMLRNSGGADAKPALLPLQAWIEFASEAQFSSAFAAQAASGIHTGLHGRVVAFVSEFQVTVFREFAVV